MRIASQFTISRENSKSTTDTMRMNNERGANYAVYLD